MIKRFKIWWHKRQLELLHKDIDYLTDESVAIDGTICGLQRMSEKTRNAEQREKLLNKVSSYTSELTLIEKIVDVYQADVTRRNNRVTELEGV